MLNNDYVDTPIGSLPKEWEVLQLKDATIYKKVSLNPQSFPAEEFEYYSIPAYAENGTPVSEIGRAIRSQKLLIEQGEVLFGKLNPRVPKIWHVTSDTDRRKIASTEFIPLKYREGKIHDKFLYFLAWSEYLLPKSQELVSGSTPSRQRVDVSAFLNIPIPLPPLPEQRAIAHVLSTIRQSIEATEQVINAAHVLKRSLMKYLFTYGPVPFDQADQVVLKDTIIGEIPERWSIGKLGSLVREGGGSLQTGPFGSQLHASDYVDSGVPFIMPKDLGPSGEIITNTIARINSDDFRRLSRHHLVQGDIVLARRGELGRRGLVTEIESGWVCGTGSLRIRPGNLLFSPFLNQLFETTWLKDWLLAHAIGTTMANLSSTILADLPILLPPMSEQKTIALYLSHIQDKITAEEQRRISLNVIFDSLLHHLMTGKIRVNQLVDYIRVTP